MTDRQRTRLETALYDALDVLTLWGAGLGHADKALMLKYLRTATAIVRAQRVGGHRKVKRIK